MVKQIDVMRKREDITADFIEIVSERTKKFTDPPITTIGGYALRAYVPFRRYTRDCDFVILKRDGWQIDSIGKWFSGRMSEEAFEKHETSGFLRLATNIAIGSKTANVSIDFIEGEVRGRKDGQLVLIDRKLIENRKDATLQIGSKEIKTFVPDYTDYLILKIVSSRPSDVRDIAALVWKRGIPENIGKRLDEIVPESAIFEKNIKEIIIPRISDEQFVNSWRGTFVTTEFDENVKEEVLKEIRKLAEE